MKTSLIVPFDQITAEDTARVGGKGANLGEMARAGFPVPPGFCITTQAFKQFVASYDRAGQLYAELEALAPGDVEAVRDVGQRVRGTLTGVPIPEEIKIQLLASWRESGSRKSYAVRSSATAEDLPTASFAGQQDTYLNVRSEDQLLESVRACWISLFTDRAILYRLKNGFSHRGVQLSVVVQEMVAPDASGVMFTADPVSGHRQIISIDASYGLGEALVAGLVTPDLYKVDKRDMGIVETQVAEKQLAIYPKEEGGTAQQELEEPLRSARVLTGEQISRLADLGVKIKAHYGQPQDIEWVLKDDQIHVVQSRPITSLFPLPAPAPKDAALHVYVSLSHAQVMTDPMPPMAVSIWKLLLPVGKRSRLDEYNPYMLSAAGRLYLDLTPAFHLRPGREMLPRILTIADPLIAGAIREVIHRDDFKRGRKYVKGQVNELVMAGWLLPRMRQAFARLWFYQPEGAIAALNRQIDAYLGKMKADLNAVSPGAERLGVAKKYLTRMFLDAAMPVPAYLVASMLAKVLLARISHRLGEPADLEIIARGLHGNVTTDMDLEVGDLANLARQSQELKNYLLNHTSDFSIEDLSGIPGAKPFLAAWQQFIEKYGLRAPSEIDISRPRWQDKPGSLLQVIAGNLEHHEPGEHRRKHQRLVAEAEEEAGRLIAAARRGPFGWLRGLVVRRLVRVARNLLPVREHPKFLLIRAMGYIRESILECAELLVSSGRMDSVGDVWHLELPELLAAFEEEDKQLLGIVSVRKAEFQHYWDLNPPRVITSDGEIPVAKYTIEDLPEGALAGNPVSNGVVEGLARVVLDPNTEVLSPGEILVAPFTDPGWTPLFINAAGLVMEVGGLMTHGSVVAREYGIPAVVGVLEATQKIRTGQRIRVHGDQGYVEFLN